EYQFYILSNCGDGDISMMSLPVSFYTLCDGTPGAGTPTSVSSSVCPESQFTIHLDETVSAGPGIAYQWQSSPEGEENWTDLEGETGESVALTQADGMDYRYYVVCSGSEESDTSAVLNIAQNPPNQCYCIPGFTNMNSRDDIRNVTFAGINHSTVA